MESQSGSRMADHFALMTGRLLTEATLRSAMEEAVAVPSTTAGYDQPESDPSSVPEGVFLDMGKVKSGVMVECRICREEGDEAYMETPCSCKGSLKYAHHVCVQRWCNEKGDTNCEICLQQFTPNYTAPLKLFRHGRNPINSGGAGERPENRSTSYAQTADQADDGPSFDSQNSNPKGVIYCRIAAIVLMALLMLRDAVSLIFSSTRVYSTELITQLLMFRTAGIVIPVYIILITATALLHSCNQQQLYRIQAVHTTPVSENGGAGGLPATPPQQHQHIINIQ